VVRKVQTKAIIRPSRPERHSGKVTGHAEEARRIASYALYRSSGLWKTTIALIVARTLLKDYWKDFTLEMNASDERGIDVIREKIKVFASHVDRRAGIPFRIVLLDEADSLTHDSQTALRRIMEEFSSGTRFILTANYASGIIVPIQSRCAVFRFVRIPKEDAVSHLEMICQKEKVKYEIKAIEHIYELSAGDMRQAINQLQAAASLGSVDESNVKRIVGVSKRSSVKEMVQHAVKGEFRKQESSWLNCFQSMGYLREICSGTFMKMLHR